VWQSTIDFLRSAGHEITTVQESNLREADDELLLHHADSGEYAFITRDMHFSNILVYPPSSYRGIIVLRIRPETSEEVHAVLAAALSQFTQQSIQGTLVVVDRRKFRLRRSNK